MYKTVMMSMVLWASMHCTFATRVLAQTTDAKVENDAGAKDNAERYVGARFLRCGADYFSKKHIPGGLGASSLSRVYQYKKLHWELVPESVSEADKLNGIEWRGKIVMKASAKRTHVEADYNYNRPAGWLSWEDFAGSITFRQQKINSEWAVQAESLVEDFGDARITCKEMSDLLGEKKGR